MTRAIWIALLVATCLSLSGKEDCRKKYADLYDICVCNCRNTQEDNILKGDPFSHEKLKACLWKCAKEERKRERGGGGGSDDISRPISYLDEMGESDLVVIP